MAARGNASANASTNASANANAAAGGSRHSWLLLGLLVLALLGCNRGLWTPDEPREAEIGREMALAPSLIPTLDGRRFIEKPPLYYWVMAGAYDLSGGPSVIAARAISVVSGLATLALLYAWASSATALRTAGLTCAFMLATSVQFVVSSHWVLLDPLLMLTTTLAAWAAFRLLAAPEAALHPRKAIGLRCLLYAALTLALWIKGPIGPVLIGAGLLSYCLAERPVHWRRLQPLAGCLWLALMVAMLALGIYAAGGRAALWEWAYVNHVQRLLHPGATGHRQPLLYYAWTLPYAVLPWLPALLQALRPVHWRRSASPDAARYGAWMGAGMVVLLSLSATKRETYLLPALPLLFLWIGIRSHQWWHARTQGQAAGPAGNWPVTRTSLERALWWAQVALLVLDAFAAPLAVALWTRRLTALSVATLLIAAGAVAVLLLPKRRVAYAGAAMLATAAVGTALLLGLAGPVLNATKDMGPFMRALGRRLPPGQPVYAVHVDETLAAEVPFYTARRVIALPAYAAERPSWLLVQNVDNRHLDPAGYRLVMSQSFGPGRSLALWHVSSAIAADRN